MTACAVDEWQHPAVQASLQSTAALPALQAFLPRITIGSWAASRAQLRLIAAALSALSAALAHCPSNAAAFLALAPAPHLVRSMRLPANDEACVAAADCVHALCAAHAPAAADLAAAGAVPVLVDVAAAAQGAPGEALRRAALRALSAVAAGAPAAQLAACSGAQHPALRGVTLLLCA